MICGGDPAAIPDVSTDKSIKCCLSKVSAILFGQTKRVPRRCFRVSRIQLYSHRTCEVRPQRRERHICTYELGPTAYACPYENGRAAYALCPPERSSQLLKGGKIRRGVNRRNGCGGRWAHIGGSL
jgi:hypothetical protein